MCHSLGEHCIFFNEMMIVTYCDFVKGGCARNITACTYTMFAKTVFKIVA